MNILIAPNSMKGSLNAFDFADTVEKALLYSDLECTTRKVPVADGGDYTGEILSRIIGAGQIDLNVTGPLGSPVNAIYWISGKLAIIEMAEASGMKQVITEKLNPLRASSIGTGELILDAINRGCTEIWLTVGGSATVDGGMGMMEALGFKFFDNAGKPLKGNGENLEKTVRLQKANSPESVIFKIICDVDNPLLGKNGAATVFGPQKGATAAMINKLENGLKNWSGILSKESGEKLSDIKGTGAAGGIALPLLAYYDSVMVEGASFILNKLSFNEHVQWADIVITGEGKIDSQTSNLKAPYVVAQIAHKYRKPVYALAGIADETNEKLFDGIYPLVNTSVTKEEAMENTRELLFQKVLELVKDLNKNNEK